MKCKVCNGPANHICGYCLKTPYCSNKCRVIDAHHVCVIDNVEQDTIKNEKLHHKVADTGDLRLDYNSVPPNGRIPMETHTEGSQFFRVEQGSGDLIVWSPNETVIPIQNNSVALIPKGTPHEIRAGKEGLKIYSVYNKI